MQPGDQPGVTEIGESVQKSHATAATGKIWPDRQHAWRRADLLKSPRRGGLGGKPVSGTAGQRSGLRMRHHANIGLGGEIVARFAGQLGQMLATSSRRPASAGRVSASQDGGGCEIRTREGLPPTRFPSVRPRPLGESSVGKPTDSAHASSPGPVRRKLPAARRQSRRWLDWPADPSHGVYPANPPRAGRQQGYAGSDGCAGGPFQPWRG